MGEEVTVLMPYHKRRLLQGKIVHRWENLLTTAVGHHTEVEAYITPEGVVRSAEATTEEGGNSGTKRLGDRLNTTGELAGLLPSGCLGIPQGGAGWSHLPLHPIGRVVRVTMGNRIPGWEGIVQYTRIQLTLRPVPTPQVVQAEITRGHHMLQRQQVAPSTAALPCTTSWVARSSGRAPPWPWPWGMKFVCLPHQRSS